jgi:O-methyltransferase domain/Dimerisation domain
MGASAASCDRIVGLAYAFRAAKTLLSAVELDIFTVLAAAPLDTQALRQRLGIHERGARDFFDALVALGLLTRDEHCRYANAPDADLYLDRRKQSCVGGLLENLNAREYAVWNALTAALRSGEPQTGFGASQHFETLYTDPKRLDLFVKGMTGATLPVAQALAQKFPWNAYNSVIDIGTAQGCLPVQVAVAHGHITGGGFDLPHVGPLFDEYVAANGLSARLQFYPGDFFQGPLPSADVPVMGRVLHNWDLSTKQLLLAKVHAALPSHGVLIVYERFIDDARLTGTAGLLSSLNMLMMTAGGFDFTVADCLAWMQAAGFHDMDSLPTSAHCESLRLWSIREPPLHRSRSRRVPMPSAWQALSASGSTIQIRRASQVRKSGQVRTFANAEAHRRVLRD